MFELQPLKLQNFPNEAHTNVRIFLMEAPPASRKINSDFVWASMGKYNSDTIHPIYFKSGMQPISMMTNGYKGLLS